MKRRHRAQREAGISKLRARRHRAEREEAEISKLPAPILHHILSFLDEKVAVRTCVVSKSWRHLVSTRPNFNLDEYKFKGDKEKFRNVLHKSLQVYCDQKLCIDDFRVSFVSTDDPLLKKWIHIVTQDLGVKKFGLSFFGREKPSYFDLPALVFESESLQEINLQRCKLSQIKCIGKNNHLKTLHLYDVYIEEESFAKLMSSCPLIERFSLKGCKGLSTINLQNLHNLQSFHLFSNKYCGRSIEEIYLPSCIGRIHTERCPSWFRHRNYFPRLTCLYLKKVALPNEWFDSLSRNLPCLEEMKLHKCNGSGEFQLSSRSIKKLDITMATESTIKATFDTPCIKEFHCRTKTSDISFSTTSNEWNSQFRLSLSEKVSLCFLKLSLTSLRLDTVPLSNEWFDSFSHNFPCLEELQLWNCKGFDELQLSSRSIKKLGIRMHESTTKATVDAPSIKEFSFRANISQSISFTATTSDEWNSQIVLSLDQLDASQWFLKLSELVAAFSQSQINSLVLNHSGRGVNQHKHLSDISVCCGNSYTPVEMKSLDMDLTGGLYYNSFFSDLMNGLFRIVRPSEMKQNWYVNNGRDWYVNAQAFPKFLCRTLQVGRWEEEEDDEGMRSFFWQQDLEQVSLQVETEYYGEYVAFWHFEHFGILSRGSQQVGQNMLPRYAGRRTRISTNFAFY